MTNFGLSDSPDFTDYSGRSSIILGYKLGAYLTSLGASCAGVDTFEITVSNTDNVTPIVVTYYFNDQNGTQLEGGFLSVNEAGATNGQATFILPAIGISLSVKAWTPNLLVTIIARTGVTKRSLNNGMIPAHTFSASIPASSSIGFVAPFVNTTDQTHPNLAISSNTAHCGQITLIVQPSQAITGYVSFIFRDNLGNLVAVPVFVQAFSNVTALTMNHPYAFVGWRFTCSAVSPASATTVQLTILPGSGEF